MRQFIIQFHYNANLIGTQAIQKRFNHIVIICAHEKTGAQQRTGL